MNNYITKTFSGFACLILSLGCVACDSFLSEYSQDLAKVNSWEDLDELLLGQGYFQTANFYEDENYQINSNRDNPFDFLHVMTDEVEYNPSYITNSSYVPMSDYFGFYTWQKDTGTSEDITFVGGDESYFNTLYKRINTCNLVLDAVDDLPEPTENDIKNKARVKGEALFLRAYCNFLLANLYSVPFNPATADTDAGIVLKTVGTIEDIEFVKSSLAKTYEMITGDLAAAETLLEGISTKSVYRADHTAVNLLQSRVYLYMQDWQKAAEYANKVLKQNDRLRSIKSVPANENYVSSTSPETIFSMGDYIFAVAFAPYSYMSGSPWIISDAIISLYDPTSDMRYGRYFGDSETMSPNCFLKYNMQQSRWSSSFSNASATFMFRTPEAYLTLAEASAYMGDETTARQALEKYLPSRMEGVITINKTGHDLIDFIRDERAREFLIEGHRWFDLRRYTVCQPYPWSKEITHKYAYWSTDWPAAISHIDTYTLLENDPAYTLPIPRNILNLQVSLGSFERPDRKAVREIY